MLLSLEARGAYQILTDTYYSFGDPIPNDRFKIARILRISPQKTKKILEEISPFFEEANGFLVNKRIEFERDKVLKKKESAKANGRAGGIASAKAKAQPKSHSHPHSHLNSHLNNSNNHEANKRSSSQRLAHSCGGESEEA